MKNPNNDVNLTKCPDCGGTGKAKKVQDMMIRRDRKGIRSDPLILEINCEKCYGTGFYASSLKSKSTSSRILLYLFLIIIGLILIYDFYYYIIQGEDPLSVLYNGFI